MESEAKDVIILGAIRRGAKRFDMIQKTTQIEPKEINAILEKLEGRGFIQVLEKKGLFGQKIELTVTDKGSREIDERIHELQEKWSDMSQIYKTGNKQKLQQVMNENKGVLPTMMFFGIMDMVMFSMMFTMMGAVISDYVPAENMPAEGADGGTDGGGMDDGGFDFDIGF